LMKSKKGIFFLLKKKIGNSFFQQSYS